MTQRSAAWVKPEDRQLIGRVVGFLEYGNALRYLEPLVAQATPDELQAIDALIRERPEFAVQIDLVRDLVRSPTTLVSPQAPEDAVRRGLPWVLALAQTELAGILATLGSHPEPWGMLAADRPPTPALQELLMENAQAHYWSLTRDPLLSQVATAKPGRELLAYIRRLNLARRFQYAAGMSASSSLNPAQATELIRQERELEQLHQRFVTTVAAFLVANNFQASSRRTGEAFDLVKACQSQLDGERRELQLGTARIERFDSPGDRPQ